MYIDPHRQHAEQASDVRQEGFIAPISAQRLIVATLLNSERINPDGRVLPIEVQRRVHQYSDGTRFNRGPQVASEWKSGIVVPSVEQTRPYFVDVDGTRFKHRIVWAPDVEIYDALTGAADLDLSDANLAGIQEENEALQHTIVTGDRYHLERNTKQKKDSCRIEARQKREPDFADTSVYVAGGIHAMGLVRRMVELGADFDYAKVWVPDNKPQQPFRLDTPILTVQTYDQLRSTMEALRHAVDELPGRVTQTVHILGEQVLGLPGVYVGQARSGGSFNQSMSSLFAKPLQEACSTTELPSDRPFISSEWLSQAADRMSSLAQDRAQELGIDPENHAFVVGQPVQKIRNILQA